MIRLSHNIDSNTPTYGNRDKFVLKEKSEISKGASANSSEWNFTTNHLGTHVDAPRHFFEKGLTLTDFPDDFWYSNRVQLIDIPCRKAKLIVKDDFNNIHNINEDTEIVLIRTGYEEFRNNDKYWNDNPGLSPNLGDWFKMYRPNVKFVGFDFISLSSWKYRSEGKIAHQRFLNNFNTNPILIIEDMSLKELTMNPKNILIVPVFVTKSNGSPVTIVANLNL